MKNYNDIYYQSADGLRLYARDYFHESPSKTLLCMHGLTRNSADFQQLCEWLQPEYRIIAADQRGRGLSDYDPNPANYLPTVYVGDMFALLDHLDIKEATLIGTSMGGLMAMIMAATQEQRIDSLIINDIGPVINPEGLQRINAYVGLDSPVSDWQEAVQQTKRLNSEALPDLTEAEWEQFTRQLYLNDENGIPVKAYDTAIAEPFKTNAAPPDLWPLFQMIAAKRMLLFRGESSDILSRDCVDKMKDIKPDLQFVEVANRGHAPLLNEPDALRAIQSFLNS